MFASSELSLCIATAPSALQLFLGSGSAMVTVEAVHVDSMLPKHTKITVTRCTGELEFHYILP